MLSSRLLTLPPWLRSHTQLLYDIYVGFVILSAEFNSIAKDFSKIRKIIIIVHLHLFYSIVSSRLSLEVERSTRNAEVTGSTPVVGCFVHILANYANF